MVGGMEDAMNYIVVIYVVMLISGLIVNNLAV